MCRSTALLCASVQAANPWSDWGRVYGDMSGGSGGIDVRYQREGGLWVSYNMQFRNTFSKSATFKYTYTDADGETLTGSSFATGNGGIGTGRCSKCNELPDVEITDVKLR
jgi:hypothetical protein